jgi:serine/threonine-protein kinase
MHPNRSDVAAPSDLAEDLRASAVRPRQIAPGVIIGERYRVAEKLSEGEHAAVYRAIDLHDGCAVALKIVRTELVGRRGLRRRFVADARDTMKVVSDHVVAVLDIGQHTDGAPFYVMELIHGRPLDETFLGLDYAGIVALGLQLCHGLDAAHAAGVIHRDVRPENVIVSFGADGSFHCKLVDFGAAKLAASLTTPDYLAPEQARAGGQVDARADVYALGVLLYELVAGRLPFTRTDPMRQLMAHQHESPPPLDEQRKGCPPALASAVMRCLEKDPARRPSSMRDLADMLASACLEEAPPSSDGALSIRAEVPDDAAVACAKTLVMGPALEPSPAAPAPATPAPATPAPANMVRPPPGYAWLGGTIWVTCMVLAALASLTVWVVISWPR